MPTEEQLQRAAPLMYEFLRQLTDFRDRGDAIADRGAKIETDGSAEPEDASDAVRYAFRDIADYAERVVMFADGMGGGELLPFAD